MLNRIVPRLVQKINETFRASRVTGKKDAFHDERDDSDHEVVHGRGGEDDTIQDGHS